MLKSQYARLLTGMLLIAVVSCSDNPLAIHEGVCAKQYPMAQLEVWYERTWSIFLEVNGVTMRDLDEAKGCIMFGVSDRRVVPVIEGKLDEVKIPRDAVYYEVVVGGPR